jgi:hypothetical protein
VSGDRESSGSVNVRAGEGARVDCYTYDRTTPILAICAGRLMVDISIADRTAIPADAVRFARELASQAAAFAAECERLHAAQHAQPSAETTVPGQGEEAMGAAQRAA